MQVAHYMPEAFDLVPEYHVLSSPVRKAFKMIGALPFVEPGSVVEFWDVLKANCPSDMDAFCDYFEYTWIGNSMYNYMFHVCIF